MSQYDRVGKWRVLVLAGSRGPNEPMARHYGVSHKCLIEISGKPMLHRVVDALHEHRAIEEVHVSIEIADFLADELKAIDDKVEFHQAKSSAPQSVLAAIIDMGLDDGPILVTTADHALLDEEMLDSFLSDALASGADLLVGLAKAEVILKAYPDAKRTFLTFGPDRVSGCNLFAFKTEASKKLLGFWQRVEKNRKNPFKLIWAFGWKPLFFYLTGQVNLQKAFKLGSQQVGVNVEPVLLPMANAAVDVDKPEDKELVEAILRRELGD